MGSSEELSDSFSFTSLQEFVKKPITTIPEQYVHFERAEGERQPFAITIPTIDMTRLVSGNDDELQKLHSVCKEWGLFQSVRHGVNSSVVDKLKLELEEFYNLPFEEKMKYKIGDGDVEGYGRTVGAEGKLDWADRFYMITNPVHRRKPHLFPELPSSLRITLESYLEELQKLARKLLTFMAKALKIEKKEMEDFFEDGMQSIRMTYYPPCPKPELVMGITPHSDATLLTILNQINGVDGLQIKKDGLWFPVSFLPDALVVNIGDILEIFSNGVYKSIEHRATPNAKKERVTLAFFVNPKFEAEIGPSSSLINPSNPPLFKRVAMEQYVKDYFSRTRRLNGKKYLQHMKNNENEEFN